ncbi:MAG: hypothetical protein EZS28_005115, partial [Streblomastix strix]
MPESGRISPPNQKKPQHVSPPHESKQQQLIQQQDSDSSEADEVYKQISIPDISQNKIHISGSVSVISNNSNSNNNSPVKGQSDDSGSIRSDQGIKVLDLGQKIISPNAINNRYRRLSVLLNHHYIRLLQVHSISRKLLLYQQLIRITIIRRYQQHKRKADKNYLHFHYFHQPDRNGFNLTNEELLPPKSPPSNQGPLHNSPPRSLNTSLNTSQQQSYNLSQSYQQQQQQIAQTTAQIRARAQAVLQGNPKAYPYIPPNQQGQKQRPISPPLSSNMSNNPNSFFKFNKQNQQQGSKYRQDRTNIGLGGFTGNPSSGISDPTPSFQQLLTGQEKGPSQFSNSVSQQLQQQQPSYLSSSLPTSSVQSIGPNIPFTQSQFILSTATSSQPSYSLNQNNKPQQQNQSNNSFSAPFNNPHIRSPSPASLSKEKQKSPPRHRVMSPPPSSPFDSSSTSFFRRNPSCDRQSSDHKSPPSGSQ